MQRAESLRIHNIGIKQKISEEEAWIGATRAHQRITFGKTFHISLTSTVFFENGLSTVILMIFYLDVSFVHLMK